MPIERNCARLRRELTGGARLCAVVKADGYGHGAVPCARAALRGGAEMLAVAAASEAGELRADLPDATLLTMGALTPEELDQVLEAGSELAVWREGFRELVADRAAALGLRPRVHVKYDTGMGRLGERDPEVVMAICDAVASDPHLELAGPLDALRHRRRGRRVRSCANSSRASRSSRAVARERYPDILLHAANSAATLRNPASHLDMVRCGIAVYGLDPFGRDPAEQELEPALELRSYVADVKRFEAGASAGYGRHMAGGAGDLGRGPPDRLRRRRAAWPLEQRVGADRRSPAPRSWGRFRWTT